MRPFKSVDEIMSKELNLIPISRYVVERNPYWEDKNVLTGYWYDENEKFVPDEKLKSFIDGGDKPVILALGAMAFEISEKIKEENGVTVAAGLSGVLARSGT